tara:strand:+ start:302 stop:631 length:330 start_codon:yes stop_codon:yes gene_type:complete
MLKDIKPGSLCKIAIEGLTFTSDGFAMIDGKKIRTARIYEKIDLESFPSFNDFIGKKITINEGDLALVIRKVGRPKSITRDPHFFQYDVYEVLVGNFKAQIFKQNLKLI